MKDWETLAAIGKAYETVVRRQGYPRYFLASDDDGHWYIVPVGRRRDFEAWADSRDSDAPEYVVPINGDPSRVTFTDPREDA